MAGEPLRLIIVARDRSDSVQEALATLDDFLGKQSHVEIIASSVIEELDFTGLTADFVVVLGGDGAILRACRRMGTHQLPLLGINLGRLGFLADFSPEEFRKRFDAFLRREFNIVQHVMFECTLQRGDGTSESFLGLNEVAISTTSALSMLEVQLAIDGQPVTTYAGDGLIIATPVGSTAHSLSAGGPILRQDLSAFVVTPICPHTLTNRPLVDHADRVYELKFPRAYDGTTLVIDGQVRRALEPDDVIRIQRAPYSFQLVRMHDHSYFQTLYRKLGWAGQPRYGAQ